MLLVDGSGKFGGTRNATALAFVYSKANGQNLALQLSNGDPNVLAPRHNKMASTLFPDGHVQSRNDFDDVHPYNSTDRHGLLVPNNTSSWMTIE